MVRTSRERSQAKPMTQEQTIRHTASQNLPPPLVVDLDGTLVTTDLLVESVMLLLRQNPLAILKLPLWLSHGKAWFKHRVAEEVLPDVEALPYHRELLAYLQEEKTRGRSLILATASDRRIADAVADKLGLFEAVYASDGRINLSGEAKRQKLEQDFGEQGFDYAANGYRDLAVWQGARNAVLVNPTTGLAGRLESRIAVERVFERPGSELSALLQALRPHHWLKNTLVFVPLAAAHRLYELDLLWYAFLTFVAFSLCASSIYIINDLLDLPSDRHHPHKKDRPMASGRLPLLHAMAVVPVMLLFAALIGLALHPLVAAILGFYVVLMVAYSQRLKDLAILDVLVLASGYTLRVLAGAAAVQIPPSPWLIAFSGFLFFSIALTKRYAELVTMRVMEGAKAHARAYVLQDRELIAALGVASGHVAVLVLALHINSAMTHELYSRYELIWLVCGLLLYWVSHLWLMAHRGRMHDDPLVFAIKNKVSLMLLIAMAAILLIAT